MSLNLKIGRLGSAIDSATTGHFLSKGATDAVFQAVSSGLDSATITNLVDSAYIQLRDRFQDSSGITAIVDSAYVQARQSSASGGLDSAATISLINNNTNSGFYKYKYTATAGQTVFADSDANGNIMSFDPNSTLVFYNGVLLDETTDYSASSNTVTLTSGADAGVSITVAKYGVGYVTPDQWYGDRALFAYHQNTSSQTFPIDTMSIDTAANATDFGDLVVDFIYSPMFVATSNSTYVLWKGYSETLYYSAPATSADATSFGSLSADHTYAGAAGDGNYGAYGGGYSPTSSNYSTAIDYVTISTSGSGTDFGDLTTGRGPSDAVSSTTRQLFGGGYNGSNVENTIDYITIATPNNATDFGDLTSTGYYHASWGDGTYGLWAGSDSRDNVIQYVTVDTTSNASDFGDLYAGRGYAGSSGHATRMLVAGGNSDGFYSYDYHVEYITTTTPGNGTDFADLSRTTNAEHLSNGASGSSS